MLLSINLNLTIVRTDSSGLRTGILKDTDPGLRYIIGPGGHLDTLYTYDLGR